MLHTVYTESVLVLFNRGWIGKKPCEVWFTEEPLVGETIINQINDELT